MEARFALLPRQLLVRKSMLDIALKVVADCESSDEANDRDMAALAEVKEGVEKMLAERDAEYRQCWEEQGREPPSMEEWYDIMEGGDDERIYGE